MKNICKLLLFIAVLTGCNDQVTSTETPTKKPPMSAEEAHYEAQKLLSIIGSGQQTQIAAFMDKALQDNDIYNQYFVNGLVPAIQAAPENDPSFKPYLPCLAAARNLAKFAELRRLGGGQNPQSDEYRSPYWESLSVCVAAVNSKGHPK